MKISKIAIIISSFTVFSLMLFCFNVRAADISGTVYQSDGVTPVTGVQIEIQVMRGTNPCDWSYISSAYTDPTEGTYTITGLSPDTYSLYASNMNQSDYVNEWWADSGSVIDCNDAQAFEVVAYDEVIIGKNFQLETGGRISGTVYESDGITPIYNLHVDAQLEGCGGPWLGGGNTNEYGEYTIYGLPDGDVYVHAFGSELNYIDEWYNDWENIDDCNNYDPVRVIAGFDHMYIDFELDERAMISGTVYQSDGVTPVTGVEIEIQVIRGTNPCDWWHITSAYTDPTDGTYTITGLSPDTYSLHTNNMDQSDYVNKWWGDPDGAIDCNDAQTFEVTEYGEVIEGVNFALDLGGSVSGTVYESDGITPIYNLHVYVQSEGCGGTWLGGIETDEDGEYTIHGLSTGDVYVGTNSESTGLNYVDKWYDDIAWWDDCNTRTPVSVTAGVDHAGINFELDDGATISGIVYESDGVTPVTGVEIEIQVIKGTNPCDWWHIMNAYTDPADGTYTITGLSPDTYSLHANNMNQSNYVNEWWGDPDGAIDCNDAQTFKVTEYGEVITDKDFQLESGAKITGTVYQSNGTTPVTGIQIEVIAMQGEPCGEQYHLGWGHTDTSNGQYTIVGLPPGDYYLQTNNMNQSNYVNGYWTGAGNPSSIDCADAVAIEDVVSEDMIEGADFEMELGGSVSGTVYESDGTTPISNMLIETFSGACGGTWLVSVPTDENGEYMIHGLPAGDIYVNTCPSWSGLNYVGEWYDDWKNTDDCNNYDPVSVTAGVDHAGINFELDDGATISGIVYESDGVTPVTGVEIEIQVIKGTNPCDWWHIMNAYTDPTDGSYTITGLSPDTYSLHANNMNQSDYINEWWADPDGVLDCNDAQTFEIMEYGEVITGKNFQLEVGGSISGTVYESDGITPIYNLHVYVLSEGCGGTWLGGIETDENGEYTIYGIPEGIIYVGVCSDCTGLNYIDEWYNDVINCNYSDPVGVTTGENTGGIDFQLYANTDNDEDGIPDEWETENGLNPGDGSDAYGDLDSDGLSNYEEYWNDTDPTDYDSDDDGVNDGIEVNYGTDPNDPINYPPNGDITGTVYDSDGFVITGISIEITAYQSANACALVPPLMPVALSDPDTGIYTITGLPEGDYYVKATDSSHSFATEYWNGDPDDMSAWDCNEGDCIPVIADEIASPVDFELDPAGTITGRVTGSDTGGLGIANINVNAWTAQCVFPPLASAVTDSEGYYTIYGLPLGESFYLSTRSPPFLGYNYINIWYGDVYAYLCDGATPVVVEETTTINFELETGGTIAGQVTDLETGLGISNVSVLAFTEQCDGLDAGTNFTDSDGYYTIYGLPLGESLYLRTDYPPFSGYNYVNEWYDNIRIDTCDGATLVDVGSTGIDFQLDADSDGDGMPDEWEDLYGLNPDDGGDAYGDLDGDGLSNYDEYQNDTDPTNSDSDDDGVNDGIEVNYGTDPNDPINYPPNGDITGTVYDSDGFVITDISIEITAYQSANACALLVPPFMPVALSDPDTGIYTITGLPEGDYYVKATDSSHSYATEYWNGDPDDPSTWDCNEGDYIPVIADEIASPVDFELDPAGTITGRVTGSDTGGLGIANINVNAWTAQCVFPPLASAVTDSDGYYNIYGLPIGESFYLSTGYPPFLGYNYINIWYGDVYAHLCDGATPVVVEETTTINFELETGGTITGQVTDLETGLGISNVNVFAFTEQCDGLRVQGGPTDAEGYYTIYGLPLGESFYLSTDYPPILGYNYVNEWYDNIRIDTCDGAKPVLVGSTNIDFELDSDGDSDGMPNEWEDLYGLNPEDGSDAGGDPDSDGLSNYDEYQNGTDPTDSDSDNDGMPDGWEVQYDLDPLVDDASIDMDVDGYTNLEEYQKGTDPTDPDSHPIKAMPWIPLLLE